MRVPDKKRVTLKTISEILDVSTATISKALRDSNDISDEMKRKVRKLTDELGYHPNLMARSLVQRKSNIIGVIIPDLNISYYADLVQHIYESLQQKGYESIVMFHHEDPERERKNLEFLISLQVDGLLVSVTNGNKNYEKLKRIQNEGIPVICYDRKPCCVDFSHISMNDYRETKALIDAFVEQGRKKIGYIGVINGDDVTVPRYQCYSKILKEHNLKADEKYVIECLPNSEDAECKMREAIRKGVELDALLCAGGFFAFGAGRAILSEGFKMPEDVLLGEYGNNNIVQRLGISYFSIDHSPDCIATESVDLLDNYLQDSQQKKMPKQLFVNSKLIYHDHYNHEERIIRVLD